MPESRGRARQRSHITSPGAVSSSLLSIPGGITSLGPHVLRFQAETPMGNHGAEGYSRMRARHSLPFLLLGWCDLPSFSGRLLSKTLPILLLLVLDKQNIPVVYFSVSHCYCIFVYIYILNLNNSNLNVPFVFSEFCCHKGKEDKEGSQNMLSSEMRINTVSRG